MKFRFLCAGQRDWLTDHPEKVAAYWMGTMDSAQRFISSGCWHKALPQAGRAFELARIMVGDASLCDREWVSRHRASEALLRLVNARLCEDRPASAPASTTPVLH